MRKWGLGQSMKTKEKHKRGLVMDRHGDGFCMRLTLSAICGGGLPLYPGGDEARPGVFEEGGELAKCGKSKLGCLGL